MSFQRGETVLFSFLKKNKNPEFSSQQNTECVCLRCLNKNNAEAINPIATAATNGKLKKSNHPGSLAHFRR